MSWDLGQLFESFFGIFWPIKLLTEETNVPDTSNFVIDDHQLCSIMTRLKEERAAAYVPFINSSFLEFQINSTLRASAFIGQIAEESGELRYFEEIASGDEYEGRKDLGNVNPGDGRRYKGRGPIQLTGRANYRRAGEELGLNLEDNPEQASNPAIGFRIAGLYWRDHGLNDLADKKDYQTITRRINGGLNGYEQRLAYYQRALRVLGNESMV